MFKVPRRGESSIPVTLKSPASYPAGLEGQEEMRNRSSSSIWHSTAVPRSLSESPDPFAETSMDVIVSSTVNDISSEIFTGAVQDSDNDEFVTGEEDDSGDNKNDAQTSETIQLKRLLDARKPYMTDGRVMTRKKNAQTVAGDFNGMCNNAKNEASGEKASSADSKPVTQKPNERAKRSRPISAPTSATSGGQAGGQENLKKKRKAKSAGEAAGNNEYAVEGIQGVVKVGTEWKFFVKWEGYNETTLERSSNLTNCSERLQSFINEATAYIKSTLKK